MQKLTQNTFGDGMVKDLNPLTTPDTALTDVLNGTLITYNGNEFVLQNDMGNCKVERAKLSPGFVPLGVKEYGDIIYIASYNPDTDECEIGSFPSPERDITGTHSIEYQTGITDGYFNTEDYNVSTSIINGIFIPDAIISKIQKLNEQEVLKLNPGDKLIMTYDLRTGQLNDENFNDFVSSSVTNKKTFSLKFFRIDDTNTLIPMNEKSVKYIADRSNIEEDEYVYFVESSGGSVAVEFKLNPLTYHKANARETSKRRDEDKKIRIESYVESDSDIKFKGSRVDVTAVTNGVKSQKSYHMEALGDTKKVSSTLSGLTADQELTCVVTPYHQYGYAPELSQTFNFIIGKNLNSSNYSNIFKWFVDYDSNRLELEFDSQIETQNETKMFIEFYDPWSNVSMIKTVSDPSVYGTMVVIIPLVDEPRSDTFDTYVVNGDSSKSIGGIPMSKVRSNTNLIMKPLLTNPGQSEGHSLIRADESLRKDHFYIVRICVYDEHLNETTRESEYTYTDFYKAIYTSDIYNSVYTEQLAIGSESPDYKPDFNKIPYPLSALETGYTLVGKNTTTPLIIEDLGSTPPVPGPTNDMQNKKFYALDINPATLPEFATVKQRVTKQDTYDFVVNSKENYKFGMLKPNLVSIADSGANTIPSSNITHENIYNLDLPINNTSCIVSKSDFGSTFKLTVNTITERSGKARVVVTDTLGVAQKIYLDSLLYRKMNRGITRFRFDGADFTTNTSVVISRFDIHQGSANRYDEYDYMRAPDSATIRVAAAIRFPFEKGTSGTAMECRIFPYHDASESELATNKWKFIKDIDQLDSTVSTGNDSLGDSRGDYGNYQFFSLTAGHYCDLESPVGGQKRGSGEAYLLFINRNSFNQLIAIPLNTNVNNANAYSYDLLKSMYVIKPTSNNSKGYYLSKNNIIYHDDSTPTVIKGVKYQVQITWANVQQKIWVLSTRLKGLTNSYVDFSSDNLNTLINAAIARKGSNVKTLNSSLEDNGFIPYVSPSNRPAPRNADINLEDVILKKGLSQNYIFALSTSESEFQSQLDASQSSIDMDNAVKYDSTKHTASERTLYKDKVEKLARLFKANSQSTELQYIGTTDGGIVGRTRAYREVSERQMALGLIEADSNII